METNSNSIVWRQGWMLLATIGIGTVVVWLVAPARPRARDSYPAATPQAVLEAVHIDPAGLIEIADNSPLQQHLTRKRVELEQIRFPALTVSGSVLARITAGSAPLTDRWLFSSSEMAGKYADLQKAISEVEFATSQLDKTKELVTSQTEYLSTIVESMKPVAKTGAISGKEYQGAIAELNKARLQGEKDVFTAKSAMRARVQTQTSLERELAQGGIDAAVFDHAVEHIVLVVANVPETRISQVHEGQECMMRFFAFPNRPFNARVTNLSSMLQRERRIIRVLIELVNPDGELRPGMFAEVGMGTEEREAVRIPAEALLHYDLDDYVVVMTEGGKWKPVAVHVGDEHEGTFEVRKGLSPGDTVITAGAILLKPAVIQVLRRTRGEKT